MSKSTDALVTLLTNWEQLKMQRPAESNFTPYGYPLSYESMDELFQRWSTALEVLDQKGYWSTSPEVAIADTPLAATIHELNGLVNGAKSNGVSWMLSSRFIETSHSIQQQISSLTRRQASVNKEVAKLLAERSAESIDLITTAARSAKSIIDLGKDSTDNAKLIAEATASIQSATTLATETNAKLATLAKEADENAVIVIEDTDSIKKLLKEVIALKDDAIAREKALSERVDILDKQIRDTDTSARDASASVTQALKDARNQGLAESFQKRSGHLESERRKWTITFAGSAAALLLISILFAIDLTSMTYEGLLVHLLRKIGLAAPLVWFGWYSAKQIGRISRVQEDYEYKAASALAFQSYKEEAKLGADPELTNKLLENAINTFGENPVRLYGNHATDAVTPIQAAIQELPSEKIAEVLAAVGAQTIRSKWGPLGKLFS